MTSRNLLLALLSLAACPRPDPGDPASDTSSPQDTWTIPVDGDGDGYIGDDDCDDADPAAWPARETWTPTATTTSWWAPG